MEKRLFIISNRLPVTIDTLNNNEVQISSGGLVSAISSYLNRKQVSGETEFTERYWVGSPGCTPGVWNTVAERIQSDGYKFLPVFVNRKSYDAYYNGMSNSVLWSLFHYFPSFAEFNSNYYDQYIRVNQEFCDVLARHLQPNDVVWIHDYHLLPLAAMLRKAVPGITIGLFLHIPFPSYEIFRIMPKRWQRELLEGMLGADMIGFHTTDYAQHFLRSLQMILGVDHDMHILRFHDRLVKVGVFPISIDFNKFYNAFDNHQVQSHRNLLKSQFQHKKIIFSVDRLDYTKGVYNRLRAYEYFLSTFPEYHQKVVFVIVVIPSRDSISKYAERKKMIDEYIGNLNSRIGNFSWQPIVYQYGSLSFHELIAMYTTCDLALITPIREGMNLVAKEFVASRKDRKGVLVLSEMTGAAKELCEALTISPSDIEEIAFKIRDGLEMSLIEQSKRMRAMQERIRKYDVVEWAADFFSNLHHIKQMKAYYDVKFLDVQSRNTLIGKYADAQKRLFLLDYDGTLAPIEDLPHLAKPTTELLDLLKRLTHDRRNIVYIVSGRDSYTLQEWLAHLDINIIAEHGALVKKKNTDWVTSSLVTTEWKRPVISLLEKYVKYCEGSFIENKNYSIAWHYRNCETKQSLFYASELYNELQSYTNSLNIQVLKGNMVIEIRNKGVTKGASVKHLLKSDAFDFIFSCGDDTTDEDMFFQLSDVEEAYTVKVGSQASYAKYNLHTPDMVKSLLENICLARN